MCIVENHNEKYMKTQFLILSAVIIITSCNTQPKADGNRSSDSTNLSADTTGMAEFNAWKAQNEIGTQNPEEQKGDKSSSGTTNKTTTVSKSSSSNNNATTASGTTHKKGWSKTAKGAVIGGVVGAGTGAVINKKNRAAGAVIGGVIGAGTGAVIGNKMDKKDGRH